MSIYECPDKVFAHFSRDFRHDGQDLQSSRERIARAIRQKRVNNIHVWNFGAGMLSRGRGRTTVVGFLVRFFADGGTLLFYRCRLDFVLEDDKWRLKGFQIFNPVINNDQPIQIPM